MQSINFLIRLQHRSSRAAEGGKKASASLRVHCKLALSKDPTRLPLQHYRRTQQREWEALIAPGDTVFRKGRRQSAQHSPIVSGRGRERRGHAHQSNILSQRPGCPSWPSFPLALLQLHGPMSMCPPPSPHPWQKP